MNVRRPLVRGLVALTAATLLLSACTTTGDPEPGGTAAAGGTVQEATVVVAQELNTIDPPLAIDSNSAIVVNNVYEGLYRLDEANQPVPAGAADLPEVSADGLTYTIPLNPDATWSDGTPVTAHDYVFAWQRAVGLDNAGENQKYYGTILNADAIIAGEQEPDQLGVEATDDHTLVVTLAAPVAYFPSMLAVVPFFPVSEAYVTEQGDAFASDSEHAVYNGPFVLADFAGPGIGTDWTYERNDEYWDAGSVRLDSIAVRVVKETTTAVNLYKSGEVHQVAIAGAQVQAEQADPGFVADTTATSAFLGYNHADPVLADPRVREAISLVIDREALTASVLADGSTPATGLVPPGLATSPDGEDFADAAGDLLTTDVARAQDLWAQARADLGVSSLAIDLQTFESDRTRAVAEYLQGAVQENLEGVTLAVTTNPVANFLEKTGSGAFGAYLVTWGADYADPSSQLGLVRSDAGTNWGGYANPEFDAALEAAQVTHATDAAARFDDLLHAQEVLVADQGVTPIYFQSSTLLRSPDLKGVVFHTAGPAFEYKSAYLED
ncbi:peptide ABC transporter substrate-binding protein [Cellulomonas shaoxiangyii]|uniref:Peptide ABC transporter substrate-binding protein n=1 Tax=Cellulomonas shaoxiangyii TaxID=2566013 RepID=A0A4P7SEB8_9CELL|nr:peptide ABC transporter substrate-binding protein [Cellulomonas shaoxiangyii]QCB92372.1 peptide ABC transporter substrate-binding protein [Cellulomonas shaoxiangyii]TGY86234.1 peptide ABC transporter substrate-binding protein [Cellulomonas shaoxiangyii]